MRDLIVLCSPPMQQQAPPQTPLAGTPASNLASASALMPPPSGPPPSHSAGIYPSPSPSSTYPSPSSSSSLYPGSPRTPQSAFTPESIGIVPQLQWVGITPTPGLWHSILFKCWSKREHYFLSCQHCCSGQTTIAYNKECVVPETWSCLCTIWGNKRSLLYRNIVSTVNLGCRLDLKRIALHARNAEYNPKVCCGLERRTLHTDVVSACVLCESVRCRLLFLLSSVLQQLSWELEIQERQHLSLALERWFALELKGAACRILSGCYMNVWIRFSFCCL